MTSELHVYTDPQFLDVYTGEVSLGFAVRVDVEFGALRIGRRRRVCALGRARAHPTPERVVTLGAPGLAELNTSAQLVFVR